MDDGVDCNEDDDGTIMMTTMRMMTTMTMRMRMMKSRNIHPPQPRVGKEGSGRHLRYLILLQPAGDGGVLFVFLFVFVTTSICICSAGRTLCFQNFTQQEEGKVNYIWAFKFMLGTFVCYLYTIIELYHYICDNSHLGHIDRELGRDCGKTTIPVISSLVHSNNVVNDINSQTSLLLTTQ